MNIELQRLLIKNRDPNWEPSCGMPLSVIEQALPGLNDRTNCLSFEEDRDTNGLRRFTCVFTYKGDDLEKAYKKVFTFLKDPRTGKEDFLADGRSRIGVHNGD